MKTEKIILPKEIYDKLSIDKDSQEVEVVEVTKDCITIRAANSKPSHDYAPRWFLLPTLISALVFLILALVLHPHLVPLTGAYSIGTAVDVIANGVALITFILAYIARRKRLYQMMTRKIYWRTFATVVASVLIISTLALVAFFWFFDQIFHGAQFDIFTSTFIFAAFSGILNYFIIFIVDNFSIEMLVNMLILVVIGGLVASMATNGNQYWWKRNFSLLGTSASHANIQFNLTLIVSGALFLALIDYIFVALSQKYGRHLRHIALRILLTLTALCIAGVGIVPNNGVLGHFWHDQIAMFIVYFMGLTVFLIRWLFPEGGKNLIHVSYGIIVFLFISFVLWRGFHYFSLTAFEILSFAASFAWLMLFINRLTSMLWDDHKTYQVTFTDFEQEEKK
ncbi:DUF998 domain-containing protein [Lactovum odontotermitis]